MNRLVFALLPFLICFITPYKHRSQSSQRSKPVQRYWEQTKTETIWRERYNNCDYGYYVLLPTGVVAHGTQSPNPYHGFLISLPDVGKTFYASNRDDRFVWVDAHYNVTDHHSLTAVANDDVNIVDQERGASHIDERTSTRLAGVPALRFKIKYSSSKSAAAVEQIIALRSDIVYTVGLRTLPQYRTSDEQIFRQMLEGFRLLPLPQGECSNG